MLKLQINVSESRKNYRADLTELLDKSGWYI